MQPPRLLSKTQFPSSRLTIFTLFIAFAIIIYLLVSISHLQTPDRYLRTGFSPEDRSSSLTEIDQIVFAIGSNINSWPRRKDYVKLWWNPQKMRGCVFVDGPLPENRTDGHLLPPVCVSEDTSRFRYTFRGGYRSAIRIARTLVESVRIFNASKNVKWYVFGDDDTVFFPENLAKTLSKYDHTLWYYVGSNSEIYHQNNAFSFEMAFGGGGFALSQTLAETLASVFDSCLERYPHLYGGDVRVYACLVELGVGLTHEPGFHQVDVRGNVFGLLASHPMSLLASLHHMEHVDPIFPNTTTLAGLRRLFRAAALDPARVLQLSVCYDRWFSWTVSVSWGYAVQIHGGHVYLPDVLPVQETFQPWQRSKNILTRTYSFKTTPLHPDPCRRPVVFFMEDVSSDRHGTIRSVYRKQFQSCSFDTTSPRKLDEIRVFSRKMELDLRQLLAPRRQCCDVLPSSTAKTMEISIRECKEDELIYMRP